MSLADARTTEAAGMTKIEEMKTAVKQIIAGEYKKHKDIMRSEVFDEDDRKHFAAVRKDMDDLTAATAINMLCMYLEKYYGKNFQQKKIWIHLIFAVPF